MEYEREICMGQEFTMASRRPAAVTHIEQEHKRYNIVLFERMEIFTKSSSFNKSSSNEY